MLGLAGAMKKLGAVTFLSNDALVKEKVESFWIPMFWFVSEIEALGLIAINFERSFLVIDNKNDYCSKDIFFYKVSFTKYYLWKI